MVLVHSWGLETWLYLCFLLIQKENRKLWKITLWKIFWMFLSNIFKNLFYWDFWPLKNYSWNPYFTSIIHQNCFILGACLANCKQCGYRNSQKRAFICKKSIHWIWGSPWCWKTSLGPVVYQINNACPVSGSVPDRSFLVIFGHFLLTP